MKKLTTFILSTFFAIIAFAGNVTITINGSQNMHVLIDGKTYTLANFKNNGANGKTLLITNLVNGQHTIKIYRATTANRRSTEVYSSTFTLRPDYDMKITVNGNNGRVKMAEVLSNTVSNTNSSTSARIEMAAPAFNRLYETISRKWSESTKFAEADKAFSYSSNYFSTDQIGQIIALVSTESNRLLLAKNAYNNVVDPENYSQLNDLFNTQSYRDDLASFIRSSGTSGNTTTSRVVMPDATFNQIYRSVNDQWSSSSKYTAANNAFSAATNYFSIDQVGRIISLITSETSRLQLIKNALDNIVAPANYTDLHDLLSTQASKTDLDNYLRSNGYPDTDTDPYSNSNNNTARVVMSDANFNTIYRSVNDQWSASAKYATANSAFSTATNYFNINQVKQIVSLITSESSRLNLVKNALDNIIAPANYVELYDLFNTQSSRTELDTYLRNNGYTTTATDPYSNSNNNGARVVMSDANFNTIYRSVNDQWSPNAKYATANSAFSTATNYFNINQVKQIVSLITSEASRLDLVKNALDNIITPANYVELYDLFNSQSSRTELDTYLRNNGYTNTSTDNNNNNNPSTTRTAMSEASFNNIYQTIRSQWLPLGKYSAATDAFSNSSYYYTTYQAKQIIGLLSSEDNRLQLAKNAYDNIVDPSNIAQLYDLFTLQANKDALEAYIRNYRN